MSQERLYRAAPLEQGQAELLHVAERSNPEELLLEGAEEALDAPVPLRGSYEGGAGLHAQERELVLERIARVLTAVVVANRQADSHQGADRPEAGADTLPEGLQRLVARSWLRGVDAHTLGGEVVHR